jgi:hypothetical protein
MISALRRAEKTLKLDSFIELPLDGTQDRAAQRARIIAAPSAGDRTTTIIEVVNGIRIRSCSIRNIRRIAEGYHGKKTMPDLYM